MRNTGAFLIGVLMAFALFSCLAGCSGFAPATYPAEGYLGTDTIEVSSMTRRTRSGKSIDDFHCAGRPMVCDVFSSTMQCRCPQ